MAELKTSYATLHSSHTTYRHHQPLNGRPKHPRCYLCPLASFKKALNKTHFPPGSSSCPFLFYFCFFRFYLTGGYCIDVFNHLGNLDPLNCSKRYVGSKFGPVIPSEGPLLPTGSYRVYPKRTGWFGTLPFSSPGRPCHKRR